MAEQLAGGRGDGGDKQTRRGHLELGALWDARAGLEFGAWLDF